MNVVLFPSVAAARHAKKKRARKKKKRESGGGIVLHLKESSIVQFALHAVCVPVSVVICTAACFALVWVKLPLNEAGGSRTGRGRIIARIGEGRDQGAAMVDVER